MITHSLTRLLVSDFFVAVLRLQLCAVVALQANVDFSSEFFLEDYRRLQPS